MKTIVVATDFSSAAVNATEYAAAMALSIHASLFLVHINDVPITYAEMPVPALNIENVREVAERKMSWMKELLERKTNGKLQVNSEIRIGAFITELRSVCEHFQPYAVIMGSQGTSGTERLLFGSHTINALKHLEWPLLTVPEGRIFSSISKIGLACDLDDIHYAIPTDEIKLLVRDFKAEFHILNIRKEKAFSDDTVFEASMLLKMLAELKPVLDFIINENTDEGIIEFAEKHNIDLLLILPKRHSLIDKLVHKNHSRRLVLHSLVPMMALHQRHPVQSK